MWQVKPKPSWGLHQHQWNYEVQECDNCNQVSKKETIEVGTGIKLISEANRVKYIAKYIRELETKSQCKMNSKLKNQI